MLSLQGVPTDLVYLFLLNAVDSALMNVTNSVTTLTYR